MHKKGNIGVFQMKKLQHIRLREGSKADQFLSGRTHHKKGSAFTPDWQFVKNFNTVGVHFEDRTIIRKKKKSLLVESHMLKYPHRR